jgi:hypothetical protein
MKVRLGYPDRIVEIEGDTVYVFKGRLVSAPLEEVVRSHSGGEALLSPLIREVSGDIVAVLSKVYNVPARHSRISPLLSSATS